MGRYGVDRGPGETEQTIVSSILQEAGTELLGKFNCLILNDNICNRDSVVVDISAGRGAIAIGDVPRSRSLLRG